MDESSAITAFAALSQPTRLAVVRLLIQSGADGMPAGQIAERLGVVQNTLSVHLSLLSSAGLIRAERQGRIIIYSADMAGMRALIGFLLQDCCGGRPETCAPFLNQLTCAC